MENKGSYNIAGHRIDIISGHPEELEKILIGFTPFLTRNTLDNPDEALIQFFLIAAESGIQCLTDEIEPTLIHSFDIDEGRCNLHKKAEKYYFSISETGMDSQINTFLPNVSLYLEMEFGSNLMKCTYIGLKSLRPGHLHFLLWMAFTFSGLQKQTVSLHSSVIVYDNQAILFLGESGTGKSTHTGLWLKHIPGSTLLNDDGPVIRIELNEKNEPFPFVYGSPWSGKGKRYVNERYPVAAFVGLEQHETNQLTKINKLEAFGELLPSFPPASMKDENFVGEICSIISTIITTTPVFHLKCLPNKAAAELVKSIIF